MLINGRTQTTTAKRQQQQSVWKEKEGESRAGKSEHTNGHICSAYMSIPSFKGSCEGAGRAKDLLKLHSQTGQTMDCPKIHLLLPSPTRHAGPELCEIPVNILCNETMTQTLGNPFLLVRPLENFCIAETDGCAAATGLQQPAECLSLPLSHLSPLHSFLSPSVVCHVVCCAVPISSLTGLCRRLLHMCVKAEHSMGFAIIC